MVRWSGGAHKLVVRGIIIIIIKNGFFVCGDMWRELIGFLQRQFKYFMVYLLWLNKIVHYSKWAN